MNKRKRNLEKGITLIALVITIIVTLILAGVAINTLFGDNGVLSKGTTAKIRTENSTVKEQAILLLNEYQMFVQTNGITVDAIEFLQGKTTKTGSINGVKDETKIASTDAVKIAETTNSNITAKVFMTDKTTEYSASKKTYLVNCQVAGISNGSTGKGTTYQKDQYLVEQDTDTLYILSYYNEKGQQTELLKINTNGKTGDPDNSDDEKYANKKRAIDCETSNLAGMSVVYDPSGTYEWNSEYTGTEENQALSSGDGGAFKITDWKVVPDSRWCYTGYDDGIKIKLIPDFEKINIPELTLRGAQGYNNGVKLLNDACSNLYGTSDYATAKNLSLIELDGEISDNVDSSWTKPENVTNFPTIFADEKTSGNTNGLDISEQNVFYAKALSISEESNINYTCNNDTISLEFSTWWNVYSRAGSKIWLSTRGVSYYNNTSCDFVIRSVGESSTQNKLYGINISDGTTSEDEISGILCPIVTVDLRNIYWEPDDESWGTFWVLDKKWDYDQNNEEGYYEEGYYE